MLRKSILCISDQHAPYHHPDTLYFLAALKKEYKPDCVVNMGDELDWHSISFHDHHPGLHSPKDELEIAKGFFKKLSTTSISMCFTVLLLHVFRVLIYL